jgi:hypothetical protein
MTDVMREIILPKLNRIKKAGGGFVACCPAHEDNRASLSIGPGREHPVVLHCHAGCDPESILTAIGLSWADLSKPRESTRRDDDGEWTPAGPAVAVYDYRDEAGELLYQVLRTANKDFRQRTRDASAKSGWAWRLGDVRRVPYRLPQVVQAVGDGRQVWICEGEKDVHTLESHGLVATCNSGGAGKWLEEFSVHFKDAVVAIVADSDEPGRAHARMVRDFLGKVGAEVEIFEAPDHKDITDHLTAGRGLTDLVQVWPEAARPPVLAPDLWEFIAVADEPYDWLIPDLIERGDRLILTGAEGLGKSYLARQFAVTIAAGVHPFRTWEETSPRRVLVVDCENTERQNRRQYRTLAAVSVSKQRRVPEGGLRLIHRSEGIDLTKGADAEWLMERVTAHKPDLLVIGPLYRMHNQNINEELPARRVVQVLDALRTTGDGCALITEAHAGHGQDSGGKRNVRPLGSSLFLRWPEFGLGLRPAENTRYADGGTRPSDVELVPWRGARDTRDWPGFLEYGDPGDWPWKPSLGPPVPLKSNAAGDLSADALSKKNRKAIP